VPADIYPRILYRLPDALGYFQRTEGPVCEAGR
jgi:hypothetical protein